MTQPIDNTKHPIWVAIDIAKAKHHVLVELPNGKQKSFKIKNDKSGYMELNDFLKALNRPCTIAFEPTGDYHRTLAYYLHTQQYHLVIVSSVAGARVREALYNSWDKNDPKDCQVIMHLLKSGMVQVYHDPLVHHFHDLQELSKTYHQVSLAKTKLHHSIVNHYLPLYFPEIEKYLISSRAQWFTRVFQVFTVPTTITRYTFEEFKQASWDLMGRKVAKERWLYDLYQTAQQSVGLPVQENSVAVETFRKVLAHYAYLIDLRDSLETEAELKLNDHQDYLILRTLPGIGPILALMILAESGDLRRFKHYKQYLKFCGFDLSAYQSGKTQGKPRLSKRGNARLRYAFWLAATNAIRMTENTFRKKFEHYTKREPDNADLKRKAYTAVAAKMARVAHSLIKQGNPYRCYYSDNPQWKDTSQLAMKAC